MPSIFDYKHFFDDYCKECSLDLHLSFDMPSDYETACAEHLTLQAKLCSSMQSI